MSGAVSQSLAGRVGLLQLMPLALDELKRFDVTNLDAFTTFLRLSGRKDGPRAEHRRSDSAPRQHRALASPQLCGYGIPLFRSWSSHNRLSEPGLAEDVAAEVDAWVAGRDLDAGLVTVARTLALTLRAQAARARGQPEEALNYLEQIEARRAWFAREAMQGFERWLRAEVLYDLGRYDEARHWYEGFGRIDTQAYMAPARFRLGEIYERLGDRERAAKQYNRFLQRWKDCDPELQPWVESARRAIEALSPDT